MFAEAGGTADGGPNGEIEEGLMAVLFLHGRINITEFVKAGGARMAPYPRAGLTTSQAPRFWEEEDCLGVVVREDSIEANSLLVTIVEVR